MSSPDSLTALSIQKLYDSRYHSEKAPEWLPRRAQFQIQTGPTLSMAKRVWREIHIDVQSGPEFLYRYFPFACYVFIDDRAAAVLEFSGPSERQTATVRIPVSEPVRITIVTELGSAPSAIGRGNDNRELSLLFWGMTLGSIVDAPPASVLEPPEASELSMVAPAEPSPQPVFVVGAYRSGTSVLTWAIGQHPNIWPMEESGWLPLLATGALAGYRNATTAARNFFQIYDVAQDQYMAHIGRSIDDLCRRLSRRTLQEIFLGRLSGKNEDFQTQFQLARSAMNPKRRWVDGTPENTGYIIALRELFPRARFIGLVRNPLDVVSSMLRFERAGGLQRNVKDSANMWMSMTRFVLLAYRAYGPSVVHILQHERLTRHTTASLNGVFDFLGEPHFPKAAETFQLRINSSKVTDDERKALYEEIDGEPETKKAMLDLFEEVQSTLAREWQPDAQATRTLYAMLNDWTTRMARIVGGLSEEPTSP